MMPEIIEVASGTLMIWWISEREFSFHRLKKTETFITVRVNIPISKPILFRFMATFVFVPRKF